jgi:hypothetical protein
MTPEETEFHRHRCEVRMCLEQGWRWFVVFVKDVKAKRGEEAAQRLWTDVKRQAALGNTGKPGVWIEEPQTEILAP